MGRKRATSLPYFELDCYLDDKFELIEAEYGLKGFAIVIKLYQRIYGGEFGYYCEFTPDIALLLAARWCGSSGGVSGKVGIASDEGSLPGFPKNLITDVVAASIRRDLFSERMFKKYGILTSSGIQKQYLKATSKRESVELKKEYLLISVPENRKNVTEKPISVEEKPFSGGRNQQSKSKKNSNSYKNREPLRLIEEFISVYPKDCNRHLTEAVYCDLIMEEVETEDNLVACARNYAEACRIEETPARYIRNAENFLKDCFFETYLPEKYKKPAPKKQKNGFNQYPQREYDFEKLQEELLGM